MVTFSETFNPEQLPARPLGVEEEPQKVSSVYSGKMFMSADLFKINVFNKNHSRTSYQCVKWFGSRSG